MKAPRKTFEKPTKIVPIVWQICSFPKGIPARIEGTGLLTSMFDCNCENRHCLTTKFSMVLAKSLDMVSAKFDQPITIVTAYNCENPTFATGESLQLQSSANDQLLAIWERLYPEFQYSQDDQTITIRKQ